MSSDSKVFLAIAFISHYNNGRPDLAEQLTIRIHGACHKGERFSA